MIYPGMVVRAPDREKRGQKRINKVAKCNTENPPSAVFMTSVTRQMILPMC